MVKQVIVLRKDLNMRKGKMVAQGAHASMAAVFMEKEDEGDHLHIPLNPVLDDWINGLFTKIVVGVDSETELVEIAKKAQKAGLYWSLIQDAGKTEFHNVPTFTAVAVGPAYDYQIDEITGHLKLL